VLGFATIGLYLLYLAYKYNLLFVYDTDIDTRGLIYPRALKQILTGVYLGEICLIGLFGIQAAVGPLILQIVFLIFTVLYHISLVTALDPLLKYLPKNLEVEEESLLALEAGQQDDGEPPVGATGSEQKAAQVTPADADIAATSGTTKKPNFFTKWLHPGRYADFQALRATVPRAHAADIVYNPDTERDAYHNPAVSSPTPLLWIPRDQGGVSKQEVRHTSRSIPITDEGAILDDGNNIVWDEEAKPPIYEEKVIY
jgi:calcium permeable stress-gated cation channel